MPERIIVTIGRQFGSDGREIAFKLAEKLGINCYDKELIVIAAKESGLAESIMDIHDEKPTNSLLYSLVMNNYSLGYYPPSGQLEMPISQRVFLAQFETIKSIAEKESCVIVGRCADYVLESDPDLTSFFIHAPIESRITNVAKRHNITDDKAKDLVIKTDKSRSNYYNYYTDKKWSDVSSYHLSIDSNRLGIDKSVELISEYLKINKSI